MTSITEQPTKVEPPARRVERRSGLVFAVWILAIAVAGLAAWVIYDQVVESRTAVTSEIESLIDEYNGTWNAYDGAAFQSLVTGDYRFVDGVEINTADEQAGIIENVMSGWEFAVEVVGESMMYGDGPWHVVQMNLVTTITNRDGARGYSHFTIVERDNVLLVQRHEWMDR